MITSVALRGEACITPSSGHDINVPLVIDSNDKASCTSNSNSGTDSAPNIDNRSGINNRKVTKKKKRLPSWAFRMLNLAKDITIMVLVAVTYAALSNDQSKTDKKPTGISLKSSLPSTLNSISLKDWHKEVISRKSNLGLESYPMSRMSLLVLTISTMVCLLNSFTYCSPPKVTKGPSAYPFFPKDSIVTDWYRGQVSRAIEQARTSDISFIMFYAPWDAESQNARKQFELAARYMKRQVTFAAVNCWQPGTECRMQYSKVFNWPVLIAYPSHGRGIQYNGPILAPHIIKFLQNVCRPFIRVERQTFFGDAFIHIEVDASPSSYEYAVTYSTALRLLEKDPLRDIPFTVSTRSKINPKLSIVMWNETLIYNNENGWRTDLLLTWIVRNLRQVAPWVSPSGMKSLSLSNYLKPGPALILFTPRNPLLEYVDYNLMLQSIGHDYYLCEDSADYNMRRNMTFFQSHSARLENFIRYNELRLKCGKKKKTIKQISKPLPNVWTNNSCCSVARQNCDKCDNEDYLFKDCKISDESNCPSYNSVINDFMEKNCPGGSGINMHYKTSMLTGESDPLSPQNLNRRVAQEECYQFFTAERYESALFANTLFKLMDIHSKYRISGLSCKSNSSLYLVAMDSILYYHFAEKLGINVFSKKDKSAAVIINEKMETHYIMDEEVNDFTLRQFILNFTSGTLERALKSNSQVKQKNTHVYAKLKNCTQDSFCIQELDSDSFLPTIHQPNKAVIILYYSKQCSFCNGISYTFLVAARKFSYVDNIVFARIDGDLNLLPWEYTMYSYPTILFLPAVRKSDSRAFPRNIPVTVENLVGFILTNLDPTLKIQAMWSICNQSKFTEEKSMCLSSTRLEILSLIESTLRYWRKAPVRQKAEIFRKLQMLKHLHLLLAHSSQKVATIQKSLDKLHNIPSVCGDYSQNVSGRNRKLEYKDEL